MAEKWLHSFLTNVINLVFKSQTYTVIWRLIAQACFRKRKFARFRQQLFVCRRKGSYFALCKLDEELSNLYGERAFKLRAVSEFLCRGYRILELFFRWERWKIFQTRNGVQRSEKFALRSRERTRNKKKTQLLFGQPNISSFIFIFSLSLKNTNPRKSRSPFEIPCGPPTLKKKKKKKKKVTYNR